MNENLTEIVFILDRSGSMGPLKEDTVGGFNSLIVRQKDVPGHALISTVLFNTHSMVLHDRVRLEDIAPMKASDYVPLGSTALLDAVGDEVLHISNIHKYAREEDRPAHTLIVIMTDGLENASSRWEPDEVKSLIERQQQCGWEFLFLGADIDVITSAADLGIGKDHAAEFLHDGLGVAANFSAIAAGITSLRKGTGICSDWAKSIARDTAARKKR